MNEEKHGIILGKVGLKALEEHQLTDCAVLLAAFYDMALRHWFEKRADRYLVLTFRRGKTKGTPDCSGVLQLYFLYFRFKLFDVIFACLLNFFDPGPAIIFPYIAHFPGQFLVHDHCELYIHLYHPMEILSERH